MPETGKARAAFKPLLDCSEGRDTVFANGDYLRFITLGDTAFDGKVRINGAEAVLGYNFTCPMPAGLIPSVWTHAAGRLVLLRGYGFHYREAIVCSSRSGAIHQQRFETEVATGATYDLAYPDPEDTSRIMIMDRVGGRRQLLQVPRGSVAVRRFAIGADSLVATGTAGRVFALPLRK